MSILKFKGNILVFIALKKNTRVICNLSFEIWSGISTLHIVMEKRFYLWALFLTTKTNYNSRSWDQCLKFYVKPSESYIIKWPQYNQVIYKVKLSFQSSFFYCFQHSCALQCKTSMKRKPLAMLSHPVTSIINKHVCHLSLCFWQSLQLPMWWHLTSPSVPPFCTLAFADLCTKRRRTRALCESLCNVLCKCGHVESKTAGGFPCADKTNTLFNKSQNWLSSDAHQ